jgi:hypothetical protein
MNEDHKLIALLKNNDPVGEIADQRLRRLTTSILAKTQERTPSAPKTMAKHRHDWPRVAVCTLSLVLGVAIGQLTDGPYTNSIATPQAKTSVTIDVQEPEFAVIAMATPWADWMEQGE